MTRYLTSSDPDVPHVLEAPNAGVDAPESEEVEVDPVGFVATEDTYQFNPVMDRVDHEVDTSDLHRMEVPRHDRYAEENSGIVAERVVPYTATGANPSYGEDRTPGIGETDPDVPEEMLTVEEEVPEVDEGITTTADVSTAPTSDTAPGPADIPPPPESPAPVEPPAEEPEEELAETPADEPDEDEEAAK